MIEKNATIVNKLGLHARAAAKLVSLASGFESSIHVEKDGRKVNGKSIMGVMMLAASKDSTIRISAEGSDETDAIIALVDLVGNKFGEEI